MLTDSWLWDKVGRDTLLHSMLSILTRDSCSYMNPRRIVSRAQSLIHLGIARPHQPSLQLSQVVQMNFSCASQWVNEKSTNWELISHDCWLICVNPITTPAWPWWPHGGSGHEPCQRSPDCHHSLWGDWPALLIHSDYWGLKAIEELLRDITVACGKVCGGSGTLS